jgi:hypothetical protein
VCVVGADLSGLVLTVALSEDSFFSPGQTFAIPFEHLFDSPSTETCAAPSCAHLPAIGTVQGFYYAAPQYAIDLGWNLGNSSMLTVLPVHVTYRPLWPPSSPPASAVDAESIGLPLAPLVSTVIVDQTASRLPGPNGGLSIGFLAELQPGLYERTITPDPPFDRAFPPDVDRVVVAPGSAAELDPVSIDYTVLEPPGLSRMYPTFDITLEISRAAQLKGWTAYLRDATTHRRLSPAVPLSGKTTTGVLLPTNHHPADSDALTNTQLVVAPPAGQHIPMGVFSPQGGELAGPETYPDLPPSVPVGGVVIAAHAGAPVEADLFFEATAIDEVLSTIPNNANFEYMARASARIDPATGDSLWSVELPPGHYRVTARPLDTSHPVTIVYPCASVGVKCFEVAPSPAPAMDTSLRLEAQPTVEGRAVLSDGRALAGATVEAVPSQCADDGQSPYCLPRAARATTGADGSFVLSLDLGVYWLRVEPNDGTGFPWVVMPLVVGTSQVPLAPVVVPAPVYKGLTLNDPRGNPIVNAIVRVYQVLVTGGAVEVGRALTDAGGHYDLFLAPQ